MRIHHVFPIPRRDVFIAAIPTGLQISNKEQGGALNFKGLSQDGERLNLTENLRASPFNKELLNETTFTLIHLAGQYL